MVSLSLIYRKSSAWTSGFGPKGEILLCRISSWSFSDVLWCSPQPPRSTHSALTCPFKILTPSGLHSLSTTFRVSTTLIISITDVLCLGYHRTISEPFGQSQNVIRSITETFRHFYHLDHASTLKEVSVLCLLFQSLLLLCTSPFSCSIKGLDTF